MITFTQEAIDKVRSLKEQEDNSDLKLRVSVQGGGCSGLTQGFSFDENTDDDDIIIEQGGITILIDPISIQYLDGSTVDYEDNLVSSSFVIHNPNQVSKCGCGKSFQV